MTYQALARKWRPRNFAELVGQQHVRRALVNALRDQRIHPAYLFAGTRGVGKTTLARILAKCLNCESGITSEPCGECSACQEIDEGRFIDLIEVDAASRTRVEDTRELLDNVQYAPTRGRYKVYLIDEVHMLSGHSFNALLKTLEEPPPHVQFLLATTDPQKLPATILSRCVQFSLKHIPESAIIDQLKGILEQEGIVSELEALRELARAADGSLRDALSLLDQAVAYGGGVVHEADVYDMLGTVSRDIVLKLLRDLATRNAAGLLTTVDALADQAIDFNTVLTQLLSALHRIAVRQFNNAQLEAGARENLAWDDLANTLSAEDVQLFYQIALIGRRDLPLSAEPRSGFEMIMLRMLAFQPGEPTARPLKPYSDTPSKAESVHSDDGGSPGHQASASPVTASETGHVVQQIAPTSMQGEDEWAKQVASLGLSGLAGQLASHSILVSSGDGVYQLAIERSSEHLCTSMARQRLVDALSEKEGRTIRVDIQVTDKKGETPAVQAAQVEASRQLEAEQAIETDEWINSIRAKMGAKVVPGSVRPCTDTPDWNDK